MTDPARKFKVEYAHEGASNASFTETFVVPEGAVVDAKGDVFYVMSKDKKLLYGFTNVLMFKDVTDD